MQKWLLCLALSAAFIPAAAQTDSAAFFLQKGLDEKAKGRVMESYKYFDKAYSFNKANQQITQELADVLLSLRRYAPAKEKYMQLEKMGVSSPALYKALTELSSGMRQNDDAIKYAQLLKKADPAQKVSFAIGKTYYDAEDYGNAIKYLSEAAKEDATNAEAPYLIARAYADMSNYKQAMPYFEKALLLDPANNRKMYETGLMYYAMHDDKNALKYLLLAGEKGYKRDPEYLENVAVAYLANKQFDEGINILKEALQRRPTDVALLQSVAEACYDAKRYDDAIGYWDQILVTDKENASALFMIGMSYQKKGDKAKGQGLCDRAIQMDPSLASKKQKLPGAEW